MAARAEIRDAFRMLRALTPYKLYNAALLWGSYHYSRARKRPLQLGMPMAVSVEPTTSCNLRCPECPSGLRSFSRPTGMLRKEVFEKILDDIGQHVWFLTFYFQGEPFLHPNFLELVKAAKKRRIYVSTSTNAHYMGKDMARRVVESGIDRVIISIDGTTQEVYKQYRVGGKLDKVIEGAKNLVEAKKNASSATPYVIFQFLVVRPNEHQVEDARRLARELGVDEIKFKSAQLYDFENGNPLMPEAEEFSRYRKGKDGKYRIRNRLLDQCWKMWHSCVFTWDADVVPCCFDKDAKYPMGSALEKPFREVWKGEKYRRFRSTLLNGRSQIDICNNCTEGTRVWLEAGAE